MNGKAIVAAPKRAATVVSKKSAEALISQAIDKGVDVGTMERLLAMRRELKAEAAKEAFDMAMAKFQAECPTIVKTKEVRGKNGLVAYRYAPIESIVSQVKVPLQTNGFSYKTEQELKETGVKITVRVIHSAGHSEETSMEVPFGSQTQIMSQSQVAAAASTFAKRYAFCNAFGILTGDEDTDAAPVEQEVAKPKSTFDVAKSMIERTTDVKVLNEYNRKVQGSDKYTPEQKEQLEGFIAARVQELEDRRDPV